MAQLVNHQHQSASLKVEVPGVDFEGMAREAIAAHLLKAMSGNDEIITKIVASAIASKVNEHGVKSPREYENKTPFVEWLVADMVRNATVEVLREKVAAMRPALEKTLEAQLRKSLSPAAKALAECFIQSVSSSYYVKSHIELKFSARD